MAAVQSEHVRLADFSDRELMEVLVDLGGGSGDGVTAMEIAQRCFGFTQKQADDPKFSHDLQYFMRCVGARFGWMKRFGIVEKVGRTHWRISARGQAFRTATLSAGARNGIDNAGEDMVLALANRIGEKLYTSDDIAATAMRREFMHHVQRRKYA
jgi:hypothetical protein